MQRRRRCSECRELFNADPRVGKRQRTCGATTCRAARHRDACREWRERERPAVEADRLRRRLGGDDEVHRAIVRDVMGPKAVVVLEQLFRLAAGGSRDAFATRTLDLSRKSCRLVSRPSEDACDPGGPSP